ncbi:hypothetical protein U0035_02270 [Niabella yanshanensis]|uniref:VCBS repeat-containing protein n=1 Tax=Niabella yanshanensis TaxID=577386 RepID=A0ABZ0W9Z0_9BACT|nr:hypothetical protein [Niabella yanshanensis]WQD38970.1 hypothetical protein U0035_02270 [Niabella yanshanensis]
MNIQLRILIIIFLQASISCAHAQALDSVTLHTIGDQLVKIEMKDREGITKPGDNCLRDKDGHFLSCLSAESSQKWVTDFNKDGWPDAVFLFTDEGLGGGGNAYGFDYRVVLLDDKRSIIDQYILFGGGKFSYGHLEIDRVKDGKLYATYNENPMSRSYGEGEDNLKHVAVSFSFRDNKIVEDRYVYCPLASMKKQIFKKDNNLKIDSTLEIDDRFNEACTEIVHMSDGSKFVATLSGCEELDLYFSKTIKYKAALETDPSAIKETLLYNLQFLKDNTLFKTVMNNAISRVNQLETSRIREDKQEGMALHLSLPDGWETHLFISGNKEQGSFITFRFEKPKNKAGMMDFWESMESKRKLGK